MTITLLSNETHIRHAALLTHQAIKAKDKGRATGERGVPKKKTKNNKLKKKAVLSY